MKTDSRLILVVDDDSRLREALVAVLEDAGYGVLQASDGTTAVVLTHENPVSLLVTDLVMPGQEGMETIRHFVKEFPQIPVIAISGNPSYLTMAKALGASAVLAKPIGRAKLLKAVGDLIG